MPVDPTISEDHRQDEDLVNNEPALNPFAASTRLSGGDADREVDAPEGSPDGSLHVERDFYNPFDGTRGRAGGVYLDMVERHQAEELRAMSEGREPDLKNPPAATGTPLVINAMRVDNTFANPGSDPVNPVKEVHPVSTLPVDVGIATGTTDTQVLEQQLAEAQARNESVENPDGTTAETGGVNEPGNTPSVVDTTNASTTSPDAGTSSTSSY